MKSVRISLLSLTIAAALAPGATMAASAAAPSAAPARATVLADTVWCNYRVTAATGLNVRSAPSTSARVITTLPQGKVVLASQNVVAGSGYYWRQTNGGWAVSQYLSKVSAPCLTA